MPSKLSSLLDYPYRFTKKLLKKRQETNTDKIETTGNTYMLTKTNRNTHRHKQFVL